MDASTRRVGMARILATPVLASRVLTTRLVNEVGGEAEALGDNALACPAHLADTRFLATEGKV
jgi:hypothetical protein